MEKFGIRIAKDKRIDKIGRGEVDGIPIDYFAMDCAAVQAEVVDRCCMRHAVFLIGHHPSLSWIRGEEGHELVKSILFSGKFMAWWWDVLWY